MFSDKSMLRLFGDVLEDMGSAKAKERASASDIVEVVVGICNAQCTNVLGCVLIGVSYE